MASAKREASPEASPLKGPAPKAVPEDTSDANFEDGIPLSPMASDQTVQFISATPVNGDAKVEIGETGTAPTFVGLGKEELMKYANDPFWIRLRWILFILFWVLWIAMLVGAIVIIVLAPRCAEKKTSSETFYQMKAGDLIKDGKYEEHAKYLQNLGVETVVISDVLQYDHDGNNPEAITHYEELDQDIEPGLFASALKEVKAKGIKILLQLVPNHSGTKHEWFNDMGKQDYYVREPFETVKTSPWATQDSKIIAWTRDPRNETKAYLQQFSGNVADLNFRNDEIVDAFKGILNVWREKSIDGFVISKASFLVEDLTQLMNRDGMKNQPENVKIISKMIGLTASGPNLVELDSPSDDTIKAYIEKGLTPVIKSIDTSNPERIRQALEDINKNPKAVIDLPKGSPSQEKDRLISLLISAGGSHTVLNHESAGDLEFLKKLVSFQKDHPRGKSANIQTHNEGDIVSILRVDGDDYLIVANLGDGTATFTLVDAFNKTVEVEDKGVVALVTPNAQQKPGDAFDRSITLNRLSGAVIKLAKKEVAAE